MSDRYIQPRVYLCRERFLRLSEKHVREWTWVPVSRVWKHVLVEPMGMLRWHNPLRNEELVNNALLSQAKCTSGIKC